MKATERTLPRRARFRLGLMVAALACGCATEPPFPATITISPPGVTIRSGAGARLVATVIDQDGRAIEGARVDWSSSDSSVATVSGDGMSVVVKPAGSGSASVSASVGPVEAIAPVTVDADHRLVLMEFYRALDGDGWKRHANWGTDAPLGTWHGVKTDAEGKVTELTFGDNGLTGMIPASIAMLETLEILFLINNSGLTGSIPPQLGNLPNLWYLTLYYNSLSGPIPPELGNLTKLEILQLRNNELTGSIPPELGNLRNLNSTLSLDGNRLTGPIPPELGNLRSLVGLWTGGNQLTGPIPPELGKLRNLGHLWASGNQLTGPIPPELGKLQRLSYLLLSHNELSGPVPPELGGLRFLSSLRINHNPLSGRLPREMIGVPLLGFSWHETDLCSPPDQEFQEWLESIEDNQGNRKCSS